MEQTQEVEVPTTPEGWYSFIVEMRSIHTSNTPRYKAMWVVFHKSVLRRLEEVK